MSAHRPAPSGALLPHVRTLPSLAGALTSAVVAAALTARDSMHAAPLVLALLSAPIPLYLLASYRPGNTLSELARGFLLGANASLNALVWHLVLPTPWGSGLGLLVGAVNLLAASPALSRRATYQRLLVWTGWLFPSSWLVLAAGFVLLAVSVLLGILPGLRRLPLFRLHGFRLEPRTATLFLRGGLVANLNYLRTAFDMGAFAFVHRDSRHLHLDHEAGHALNLAAFGSVFHFVGAIDENLLRRGARAYAELLAESNVPGSRGPLLPMWRGRPRKT